MTNEEFRRKKAELACKHWQGMPGMLTMRTDRDLCGLLSAIRTILIEVPLEDGVTHPAEPKALALLNLGHGGHVDLNMGAESADILRLIGRVGQKSSTQDWRSGLIEKALKSRREDIREAAVEAVEQWEDSTLLPILKNHQESIEWIRQYLCDVISDIEDTNTGRGSDD